MKKMVAVVLMVVAGLFMFSAPNVMAQLGPCTADFDCDLDVDADDVTTFLAQFGREPSFRPCPTILCPIACDGTLSPLVRWCDQGDGTVQDMTTGLVWLRKADWGGTYPLWADFGNPDAHHRAAQLWDGSPYEGTAGLSDGSIEGDWRLPTKTEFVGILVGDEHIRSSQMYFFTGVLSLYYWSSTSDPNSPSNAWGVRMDLLGAGYSSKLNHFYVWPVRGGH